MRFATVDPSTNRLVESVRQHRWRQVETMLRRAVAAFEINRTNTINIRAKKMKMIAEALIVRTDEFAQVISLEMGKPIKESRAEVEKCAWICNYYADNAKHFLKDELIKTEYSTSLVTHAPLGIILAIMPWNFPFWQVFRAAVPAIMAGNVVLLKHAPNTPKCAMLIESLFREAQFAEGVFQNLFIDHKKVRWLIERPEISGVTLTGSEEAGSRIAEVAGKHIKKTVLELGGSDPFIVLQDANTKKAAEVGVKSRFLNCGQSCIAAKRFIVIKEIARNFIDLMTDEIRKLQVGPPQEETTTIGPMAREDLAVKLDKQVRASMKMGARAIIGGYRPKVLKGAYFAPTLLVNVSPGMPVFDEEVFGPVASIITVNNIPEAIELANKTRYGLGASIWTVSTDQAQRLARHIQAGSVFINSMVKSDPRLPFGGIKKSGYGRELSGHGIREFVNVKTLVIEQ